MDVVQRELRLVGNVLVLVDVFDGRVSQVVEGRAPRFVAFFGQFLGCRRRLRHNTGLLRREMVQSAASQTLHDDCYVVAAEHGHIKQSDELRVGAVFTEVALLRHFDVGIFLAKHREGHIGVPLQFLHQIDAVLAGDDNRCDNAWKQHDVACRQNGHFALDLQFKKFGDIALVVGNHLNRCIGSFIHCCRFLLILNLQSYEFFSAFLHFYEKLL